MSEINYQDYVNIFSEIRHKIRDRQLPQLNLQSLVRELVKKYCLGEAFTYYQRKLQLLVAEISDQYLLKVIGGVLR